MFAMCVFKPVLCIIVSPNGVCSSLSRLGRNWALFAPCMSCRGVCPHTPGLRVEPPHLHPHPPFLFVCFMVVVVVVVVVVVMFVCFMVVVVVVVVLLLLLCCCCCCCCCCYVCLFVLWLLMLLLYCFGCKTPRYLLVFASLFVLFVCMKTFVNFRMFCAGFV